MVNVSSGSNGVKWHYVDNVFDGIDCVMCHMWQVLSMTYMFFCGRCYK